MPDWYDPTQDYAFSDEDNLIEEFGGEETFTTNYYSEHVYPALKKNARESITALKRGNYMAYEGDHEYESWKEDLFENVKR